MKFWPSSGGRRWVLLASLCLNLVLALYVSVQWYKPGWTPTAGGLPLKIVERIASRLPSQDADILWRNYRAKEPDIQPLQAEYQRALLNTLRLTRQTDLDRGALRAAIQDARDKRIRIGDAVIDTFIDTLEKISPEGRRQLAGGVLR